MESGEYRTIEEPVLLISKIRKRWVDYLYAVFRVFLKLFKNRVRDYI